MKLIRSTEELKKGDTIIIKDCPRFFERGHSRVSGDVFDIIQGQLDFSIKCHETNTIEKVSIDSGRIFLID